jgi:6-phosphogluconolactonase
VARALSVIGTVTVVDDVAAAFADAVMAEYASRPGPRFVMALSGGPTARRCYEELARKAEGRIDWSLVDILMGDERCVPADDPDANQRLVREALVDRVGPVGSFRPMSCDAGAPSYQRVVADAGAFDLVHLGLGPDGHTASLFPGSPSLEAPPGTLVVQSTDPSSRNPHPRMTLTLHALALARLVVFTVSGPTKRAAFAAVSGGQDLPATRVRAARILWLVDHQAAADGKTPEGDG